MTQYHDPETVTSSDAFVIHLFSFRPPSFRVRKGAAPLSCTNTEISLCRGPCDGSRDSNAVAPRPLLK